MKTKKKTVWDEAKFVRIATSEIKVMCNSMHASAWVHRVGGLIHKCIPKIGPAMGWSTWNTFACNISADLIKEMADILVSSGLKDAGYR